MRGYRWAVAPAAAVVAVVACAAPSRQLTTRIVEDPLTLPRRMASVSTRVTATHYEPTDARNVTGRPAFRLGLTDRLEWADLGLRYAFLDDRPADGRAPMPFSLALGVGLRGIGYSSFEGMIVQPGVMLDALKRVADRWAFSAGAHWFSQWVHYPIDLTPAYGRTLVYASRHWSTFSLRAEAMRQLSPRVALGVSGAVSQNTSCVEPWCEWRSRGASSALILGVRPLSWLTVRAAPAVGVRNRPDVPLPTTYPDGSPIAIQPLTVWWVAVSGWLDFYW